MHRKFVLLVAVLLCNCCSALKASAQQIAPGNSAGDALPSAPTPASGAALPSGQAPLGTSGPKAAGKHAEWNSYVHDLVGPGAFLGPLVVAGFDQAHSLDAGYPPDGELGPGKHPAHGVVPEWGQGFDGYSKRYASRFGQSLVSTTLRYGLGAALRQDVSYHPCSCQRVLPRTLHALSSSFVAHKQNGDAVFSVPALVAPIAAAEVATYGWYPSRFDSSDALRTSYSGYIALPFKNLFSEFARR